MLAADSGLPLPLVTVLVDESLALLLDVTLPIGFAVTLELQVLLLVTGIAQFRM